MPTKTKGQRYSQDLYVKTRKTSVINVRRTMFAGEIRMFFCLLLVGSRDKPLSRQNLQTICLSRKWQKRKNFFSILLQEIETDRNERINSQVSRERISVRRKKLIINHRKEKKKKRQRKKKRKRTYFFGDSIVAVYLFGRKQRHWKIMKK